MEKNAEQLLSQLADKLKEFATTETVVGQEFKLGEFACKPVMKVGLGYGGGSGSGPQPGSQGEGTGSGGGAGIGITPVGFLVTKGAEISFVSVDNKKGLSAIFEKVPDLMEKMMEMKEKNDKKKDKKD